MLSEDKFDITNHVTWKQEVPTETSLPGPRNQVATEENQQQECLHEITIRIA